jgi:hypothetical protein
MLFCESAIITSGLQVTPAWGRWRGRLPRRTRWRDRRRRPSTSRDPAVPCRHCVNCVNLAEQARSDNLEPNRIKGVHTALTSC